MTNEEAIYILNNTAWLGTDKGVEVYPAVKKAVEALKEVKRHKEVFEWCTDCKEYDKTKHCCHRFTKCIRNTVEEMKNRFSWHDIRKNPDDLPESERVVYVLARMKCEWDGKYRLYPIQMKYSSKIMYGKAVGWGVSYPYDFDFETDEVIAWRETDKHWVE